MPPKTWDVRNTITKPQYIELVSAIFDHLETIPADWNEEKIFISGEFDSNQTEFERMSNALEIGVVANSKGVGHSMLVFLRMIIDRYPEYFFYIFEYDSEDDEVENLNSMTMDEIYSYLSKQETIYTDIYDKKSEIGRKLWQRGSWKEGSRKINISKDADEINLWDLARTKKVFIKMLEKNYK